MLLPRFFETVLDRTPGGTEVVGAALAAPLLTAAQRPAPPPSPGRAEAVAGSGRLRGPRRGSAGNHGRLPVCSRRHGVAVERVASPNDPAFVERLRGLRPDVAFNAAARLLKAEVLDVPRGDG